MVVCQSAKEFKCASEGGFSNAEIKRFDRVTKKFNKKIKKVLFRLHSEAQVKHYSAVFVAFAENMLSDQTYLLRDMPFENCDFYYYWSPKSYCMEIDKFCHVSNRKIIDKLRDFWLEEKSSLGQEQLNKFKEDPENVSDITMDVIAPDETVLCDLND